MIFLKVNDFKSTIKDNILQSLLGVDNISSDNTILNNAERTAIEFIKGYINDRYNTEYLLSRVDDDRDPILIEMLMAIVIYNLLRRVGASDTIPEIRMMEYNNTIQMLKDVKVGKFNPQNWVLRTAPLDYNLGNIFIQNNSRYNNLDY
jgi:phage gp36-like protein